MVAGCVADDFMSLTDALSSGSSSDRSNESKSLWKERRAKARRARQEMQCALNRAVQTVKELRQANTELHAQNRALVATLNHIVENGHGGDVTSCPVSAYDGTCGAETCRPASASAEFFDIASEAGTLLIEDDCTVIGSVTDIAGIMHGDESNFALFSSSRCFGATEDCSVLTAPEESLEYPSVRVAESSTVHVTGAAASTDAIKSWADIESEDSKEGKDERQLPLPADDGGCDDAKQLHPEDGDEVPRTTNSLREALALHTAPTEAPLVVEAKDVASKGSADAAVPDKSAAPSGQTDGPPESEGDENDWNSPAGQRAIRRIKAEIEQTVPGLSDPAVHKRIKEIHYLLQPLSWREFSELPGHSTHIWAQTIYDCPDYDNLGEHAKKAITHAVEDGVFFDVLRQLRRIQKSRARWR